MAMCYRGNKESASYHIVRFIENLMTDKKQVVDLFCGGCSVACALPKRFHVVANDSNPYLMSMFHVLKNDMWQDPPVPVDAEFYNIMKNELDKDYRKFTPHGNALKADDATLVMRAKIGWAGFAGSSRDFMASFCGRSSGSATDKTFYRTKKIKETVSLLKENNVQLTCIDYKEFQPKVPTVFYCDPPFSGKIKYPVTSFQSEEFFDWCRNIVKKGHVVLVSEISAPKDFKRVWDREGNLFILS